MTVIVVIYCVFTDGEIHSEEGLVRLVESPSTVSAESVPHRLLQHRLMSCQLSDRLHHVEPQICGYYHALTSRTSTSSFQQTERVAMSNDRTSSMNDSDSHSTVNLTDATKSEIEPSSELDNTSSGSNSPAAVTVAKLTTELMSDTEPLSESTVAGSSLSGTGVHSFIPVFIDFIMNHLCY